MTVVMDINVDVKTGEDEGLDDDGSSESWCEDSDEWSLEVEDGMCPVWVVDENESENEVSLVETDNGIVNGIKGGSDAVVIVLDGDGVVRGTEEASPAEDPLGTENERDSRGTRRVWGRCIWPDSYEELQQGQY